MAWWNPKDWFNEKPQAAPTPIPNPVTPPSHEPGIWVRLNPEFPHQGLDHYSDSLDNPFPIALFVPNLSLEEARSRLVGKVVDWTRFTPEQLNVLKETGTFTLGWDDLQRTFR